MGYNSPVAIYFAMTTRSYQIPPGLQSEFGRILDSSEFWITRGSLDSSEFWIARGSLDPAEFWITRGSLKMALKMAKE